MKKRCSQIMKLVAVATLGGMMSLTTACSSDSTPAPTSTVTKVTTLGTLEVSTGGKTPQTAVTAPAGSTLSLAAGTVFTNISSTAIPAGTIPTTVTISANPADLPAAALAVFPADHDFNGLLSIDLGPIKYIKPPMAAKTPVPGAIVGSTVDIYSFSSSTSTWTLEQSDLVVASDGTVSFDSDHPSIFASAHQKRLSISGIPATFAIVGSPYSFVPTVVERNPNAVLTFTITNKPGWASFSTSTGALTGTPTVADVGTTSGIVICVSDMNFEVCLPPFSITVLTGSGGGGCDF